MERFLAAPQTAHVTRCLITDLDKCATFRPEKTTCPVTALIRSKGSRREPAALFDS
jgi:hypothetical protein